MKLPHSQDVPVCLLCYTELFGAVHCPGLIMVRKGGSQHWRLSAHEQAPTPQEFLGIPAAISCQAGIKGTWNLLHQRIHARYLHAKLSVPRGATPSCSATRAECYYEV